MRASHRSRLDSEIGPAVMPSGGEDVRFLYSWNNRLEAIEEAIFTLGKRNQLKVKQNVGIGQVLRYDSSR